jgi:hypothetical protein
MTGPTSVDIPKPLDWQQFERLSRALFTETKKTDFVRYGRSGQRQNGIDVIGSLSDGSVIGIQCKGRTSSLGKGLTKKEIDDAIADAETYQGKLIEFFLVTTANEDVVLQNYVIQLNFSRKENGKFGVTLWAWQSISDQIRSCPKVLEDFYGGWKKNFSIRHLAILITFTVVLSITGWVIAQHVAQSISRKEMGRVETIKGAQIVTTTLDQLQDAYSECISSMSGNGKAFSFSTELMNSCINPIDVPLKLLQQQQDQLASVMSTNVFNEVISARTYIFENFRQLLVATKMAESFEGGSIEKMKGICPNIKERHSDSAFDDVQFRKEGENALSAQMSRYFEIRDFVIPAIIAIKAKLAIVVRMESGQEMPVELVERAKKLTELLEEERSYTYTPVISPFSTARIKEMSARNLKITGNTDDVVENLVWQQTAQQAVWEALKTRPSDIEYLISCGVLNEKARILSEHGKEK